MNGKPVNPFESNQWQTCRPIWIKRDYEIQVPVWNEIRLKVYSFETVAVWSGTCWIRYPFDTGVRSTWHVTTYERALRILRQIIR